MTEKIKMSGLVKAISNPFSDQPMESKILMIETHKGLVSIPVENPRQYHMHQKVNISIVIKEAEERGDG